MAVCMQAAPRREWARMQQGLTPPSSVRQLLLQVRGIAPMILQSTRTTDCSLQEADTLTHSNHMAAKPDVSKGHRGCLMLELFPYSSALGLAS